MFGKSSFDKSIFDRPLPLKASLVTNSSIRHANPSSEQVLSFVDFQKRDTSFDNLKKNLASDSFTINLYRPLQTISFESPKQGLHISLVKSIAVLLRMVMPFHSTYVQGVLLISFKTVYLRYGPPKIFSSTI